MAHLLLTIADKSDLDLRVLRSFQAVHRFLVSTNLPDEGGIVDLDNLVASHHTSTFCRTIADDILYTDGILTDDKLDTDAEEGTAQIIVGNLSFTRCDIDRVGIELCQNLGHSLFHEIVNIDRIDILIINDMKQIVQLITTRIDDVKSIAREMVGIKSTHKDADDHTYGHPQRGKTVCFVFTHDLDLLILYR